MITDLMRTSPAKPTWLQWIFIRRLSDDPIAERLRRNLIRRGGRIKILLGEFFLFLYPILYLIEIAVEWYFDKSVFFIIHSLKQPAETVALIQNAHRLIYQISGTLWFIHLIAWPFVIANSLKNAVNKLPLDDLKIIPDSSRLVAETIWTTLPRLSVGVIMCIAPLFYGMYFIWLEWIADSVARSHSSESLFFFFLINLLLISYSSALLIYPLILSTAGIKPAGIKTKFVQVRHSFGIMMLHPAFRYGVGGFLISLITTILPEPLRNALENIPFSLIAICWGLLEIMLLCIILYLLRKRHGLILKRLRTVIKNSKPHGVS